MLLTPLLMLKAPLPNNIIPPQSPLVLAPTALSEVNTIGLVAVPSAINLEPLVMINAAPATVASPRTTTPGSIVKVALFFT